MTREKSFRFKHFTVHHDRCAMKVGTDGVLLGAWADVEGARTALDIGTGTGLIALMLAERNGLLRVTGIDIDPEAVAQARENVLDSPWADRIVIRRADFTSADAGGTRYDLIVSNPPFHTEDTLNPDASRTAARHTASLPIPSLVKRAGALLGTEGRFCLIVPTRLAAEVIGEAAASRLFLTRRTDVKTTPQKPAKRSLLEFVPYATPTLHATMTLQNEQGQRSAAYAALTHDFYLN